MFRLGVFADILLCLFASNDLFKMFANAWQVKVCFQIRILQSVVCLHSVILFKSADKVVFTLLCELGHGWYAVTRSELL